MSTSEQDLSRAYANTFYLTSRINAARYTRVSGAINCDECVARQHERPSDVAPRRRARTRRATTSGSVLFLCSPHAELWRERDVAQAVSVP